MAQAALEKDLPGQGLPWMEKLRLLALDRFNELGYPTTKLEDWRFTNAEPIAKTKFCAPAPRPGSLTAAKIMESALAPLDAYRLVFLDGRHVPDLSSPLPRGVVFGGIAGLLKAEPKRLEPYLGRKESGRQAFSALNTAFFADGAAILLPKNLVLDKPVHFLFATSAGVNSQPVMAHARALVLAEAGAQVQIVEEHVSLGAGAHLSTSVTEILAGENSDVTHLLLERENPAAYHVAKLQVSQERDSRFQGHSVSYGGAIVRNDVCVRLEEEGASCALNGLYFLSGAQHLDNHTMIEHQAPHGTSRELYKGVLDGRARAVFDGPIHVAAKAQKTDAQVYNKNLLLSEQGLINTKPEFKINANDVQCKHGATIGQLSSDSLFYLRSRGLGAAEARALLVYAFASEMIDLIPFEGVRGALEGVLSGRFLEGAHA